MTGWGHCPSGTVGMRVSASPTLAESSKAPLRSMTSMPLVDRLLTRLQNCGICNEGTSPERCQHTKQPESYGKTGLRPRSERSDDPFPPLYHSMLILGRTARLSPDSLVPPVAAAVSEEACRGDIPASPAPELEDRAAKSTLPTFVPPQSNGCLFMASANLHQAPVQRRLAGPQGSIPPGW